MEQFDLVIIGGGSAGMSAAIESYNLGIKDTSVDLALPVAPIIPNVLPYGNLNEISFKTYLLASLLYLNDTFLNSISPFITLLSSIPDIISELTSNTVFTL